MAKIQISKHWCFDVKEDRYIHDDGTQVTGLYLSYLMKNWGRPIERTHITAVLDSIVNEEKKETKFCNYCTYPLDSSTDIKERMNIIDLFDAGRRIYFATVTKKQRSIDLCNICYSLMRSYRHTLTKEERSHYEDNI